MQIFAMLLLLRLIAAVSHAINRLRFLLQSGVIAFTEWQL